jgi:hypothetical protein
MLTGIPKLLLEELERRDMPVAELAKLAALENIRNASKTKLNEYFREAASMPGETATQLWALMTEITSYIDKLPAPVALKDADEIKRILDERRATKEVIGDDAVGQILESNADTTS